MDQPHSSFLAPQEGEIGTSPGAGTPLDAASHASDPKRQPARRGLHLPPLRLLGVRALIGCFLILVLFADVIAGWPIVQPSIAFAQALNNPNPALSTPSWLTQTSSPGKKPNLNQSASSSIAAPTSTAGVRKSTSHQWHVPLRPARLTLTTAAQHFVSSDGQLLVDIPAGSLSASQSKAGVTLLITQVKPASGSTDSGGLISFGTYEFQFFDETGKPLTALHLAHPFTVHLQLPKNQEMVWKGQQVNALWTAVQGDASLPALTAQAQSQAMPATGYVSVEPRALSNQRAVVTPAKMDKSGLTWSVQTSFTSSTSSPKGTGKTAAAQAVQPAVVQASTVAFNTTAPQASWGTPTMPQVGLNSGGLNYSYPLSIPPGPGGFHPDLALNYSSGSVDGNHGWQSAAPWVGEGWSLDLGSISWSQENVTPNQATTNENVWHINDPSGIGGQLIPPDYTYTTAYPVVPSTSSWPNPAPIWHTAPESHAKVQEILFGGYPCWRVYLPSGVMEEFGCTDPSREAYPDSQGRMVAYSWKLDMMVDRYGNQVHINYQRIYPASKGQVEDAVISDIEYDDPNCHSTSTMCGNGTGSWNPLVKIVFDANQTVAHLLNGGCGSGTAGVSRCDDPGSSTLPAPEVMSAYVLNDVKVQVQGNLLREYIFSYNQGGASTATDPNTGESEGIAGYLTLGKIQEEGTNGTALNAPVITIQYAQKWEHYSDLFSYSANNGTVCSPYSSAPRDGSSTGPCFLWSQSMNAYYITNLDNGEGWNESISWKEAHGNTWGTDNGANGGYNNAFQCSSSQTSINICGTADDKNWSRVVVASRTTNSNGVSSTWSYGYYLSAVSAAIPGRAVSARYECGSGKPDGLCESYDWGDQNDDDYADYYNGDFQSFSEVQVTLPDGSSQTDTYGATNGWGLYSSSILCVQSPCAVANYNAGIGSNGASGPVLAGKQLSELDYNSSGQLMKQINTTWSTNCPPQGVPGSQHALGGSSDPGGSQLFSELDHNNPVLVCDPRATQTDTYLTDGVTSTLSDPRVVHTTTTTSYDGNTCGSQGYDYGNVSKTTETANDVGGAQIVSTSLFCPNDNISGGTYLTDLPAQTGLQDGSSTQYGCAQTFYGGNSSVLSPPTLPDVTSTADYTAYTGGCTGSTVTASTVYNSSGVSMANLDGDGHQGCSYNSASYSNCATYDSFYTHLLTSTNAKNQVTTYEYDQDAAEAGFGQWLMAETDPNGQTTTYEYDALGRLTAIIRPGDSLSSPTVTYKYNNTCSAGKTTPCLEIQTSTRFTVGGPTSTVNNWYDGWGNLVETQTPGPNLFSRVPAIGSELITYTIYNKMGQATTKSMTYAVADTAGLGYVTPDINQARTVTNYDSLGRTLGTVTYGNATTIVQESTISYTVGQGVPTISSESSNAYEQEITLDAYGHQTISYTDGLGRTRYSQVFSGTSSPYTVVRTVGKTYDTVGNTISTVTYDSTGTAKATYSASYDGLKRLLGFNDSDLGACADTPMPADCSGPTDLAWKYTYDGDGNQLSQTDPRNNSRYTSYDNLDRPLCGALTASDAASCSGTTDEVYFYDGYSNASTPGATFPSGCTAPTGSYASDPLTRKTAEIFVGTSGAGSGWRCYGYDARGQTDQSTLAVTTPDAGTVTQTVNMTYNDGGQVTSLIYPDGTALTSNYNLNGRMLSTYFGTPSSTDPVSFLVGKVTYANDGQVAGLAIGGTAGKNSTPTPLFTLTTQYDSIQRPLSDSLTEGGQTLWSQTRAYDNDGNVLGLSTVVPTQSGGTLTENEAFCYDALNRLVWASNNGTPAGGDHCMAPPNGTTMTPYSQSYSYDDLDRTTSGSAGSFTYGDSNQLHAVTSVSSVPNPYAAYDAMGNMTCRNTDAGAAHTCGGSSPTGALMSYDSRGQLANWTAPSGTVGSAHYLYDNEGNRVLTNSVSASTTTDTIDFDSYTEVVLSGGTATTTNYYSANGERLAVKVGSTLSYLASDPLGSNSVALNSAGQVIALEHYSPYGTVDYSWGTMPTSYNYAGERLDSQTGLLYDSFRYYDPVTGEYVRSDNVQDNASGSNPYAYVGDNPETRNDPSGHCWPVCTMILGAVIGAAVSVAVTVVTHAVEHKPISVSDVVQSAVVGAVSGAVAGLAGPEAGPLVKMGVAALSSGAGQMASNAMSGKPLMDGVAQAAVVGGVTGGLMEGAGSLLKGGASEIGEAAESKLAQAGEDAGDSCGLSFRADTPVATPHGEQEIGTLQVGEQVQSYNPATKTVSTQVVQRVFINHDTDLIDVTLAVQPATKQTKPQQVAMVSHGSHAPPATTTEVVHTTQKHPWLTTKGWITAGQLHLGDQVQQLDGSTATVVGLKIIPGAASMYDLTVSNVHTFAVGTGQFVVHNCTFEKFYSKNKRVFQDEDEARATYKTVVRAKNKVTRLWPNNDDVRYRNFDNQLPGNRSYREWTVNYDGTEPGTNIRLYRRVVLGSDGSAWFTRNHYGTAGWMNEASNFYRLWWPGR